VYVNKFSHTRFEPMGHTKNPDIRIAKSIVDYIFRWLGITFLPGYREATLPAHVEEPTADADAKSAKKAAKAKSTTAKPANGVAPANGSHKAAASGPSLLERAGVAMKLDGESFGSRTEQFASFQTDAPSCDNCGAITVRNGNCYLCHNCGNSMGCS
jgi:ribonucleoside-diphosphate reductase alpha chain